MIFFGLVAPEIKTILFFYNYICMHILYLHSVYIFIYICMCVCVRACVRASVHACVGVHACIHVCVHHTYVCTCMQRVCLYIMTRFTQVLENLERTSILCR